MINFGIDDQFWNQVKQQNRQNVYKTNIVQGFFSVNQEMNFFHQYKDLFQVGNQPLIANTRLRLDNQLFIDRPYIPTYSQEHSLNSKLRQLKKDYNEFESRVKQLQELEDLPQRSQSRRKQYNPDNSITNRNNNANRNNRDNQNKKSPTVIQKNSQTRNTKNKSTIFDHYQQSNNQYLPQRQHQYIAQRQHQQIRQRPQRQQRSLSSNNQPISNNQSSLGKNYYQQHPLNESPFGYHQDNVRNENNQKENKLANNSLRNNSNISVRQNQQALQEKQLLQSLRRQNEQNTARLVKNQNQLKNKFYQQDTNNVLKQSQINHIFNWKLQKPSTFDKLDYLPPSTIPKYKIQTSVLQPRQRQPIQQTKKFSIRNLPSTNQINPHNRNKILTQHKQQNVPSKNNSAQQRRKIAKLKIDDRREKLKMVLKAFF